MYLYILFIDEIRARVRARESTKEALPCLSISAKVTFITVKMTSPLTMSFICGIVEENHWRRQSVSQVEEIRHRENTDRERCAKIYKADELLQKGRFSLSITEQRIILYTISKIKPSDKVFQEYTLNLKKFCAVCGINQNDSYSAIKKIMVELRNKSWWILMDDPNHPGTECESLINWFSILRTNKNNGNVTIMFHPDMMPYLLELARQREEGHGYYTKYEFRYVLPMRSQYAIRLYELLKSYQKNNTTWWFKIDNLKHLLDCDTYTRYADFRLRVIEPAIKEINKYSDMHINYETEKEGKRINIIMFRMTEKTIDERIEAQKAGLTTLDGNIHYWDSDTLSDQVNCVVE